jgi:threonyl-tRNA synthetase
MAKIETIRHSLSHIMAYAIQELFPETKFGIGPAIENGFYYDFDLKRSLAPEDLPRIEGRIKELFKKEIVFKKKTISKEEAEEIFKNQPYKLELIEELPGKTVSIYESGEFVDLCAGPHIKSTKEINPDAFKLTKIAGAYWRGSEKNPMLQRIYGIAFKTKQELEDFLSKEVEAEKRDHRKLGQKLDLFHIDEKAGPGFILWHPKGAILKKTIEDYILGAYLKEGYQLVNTPHIAKLNLWETSGHTQFYRENMFPPMHLREITQEEKDDYQLKPMNCPGHILIYKNEIRSYRQLPLRYTELGTVYRYERSGVLYGLTRVRGFTQDDAHIWCTPEQLGGEIISVFKLALRLLRDFGFKEYEIHLSTRPKKYVGTLKNWQKSTNSLKYALEKSKLKYQIDQGEGVFYGPKIDIKVKDSIGRAWQLTTIQVDFNLPERFKMSYIDEKGKKQTPIMIHRALLGSLERFIGVLLEYYAGNLPLWLSPIQFWLIPVGTRHRKYIKEIGNPFKKENLRVEIKDEAETVSKKIREGEIQKIPYMLVVGDKEMKEKSVRVRERGKGDIGIMKLDKFLDKVKIEIEKKK